MFHGSLFIRYINADIFSAGNRGADKVSAPNWLMIMMNRKIGAKGLLNATAMMSLDRLTEGGEGYPFYFNPGRHGREKDWLIASIPMICFQG